MASREDVQRAVEWEREKWRSAMVYWDDKHGNRHLVPVIRATDSGDRICIQIPTPQALAVALPCPVCGQPSNPSGYCSQAHLYDHAEQQRLANAQQHLPQHSED